MSHPEPTRTDTARPAPAAASGLADPRTLTLVVYLLYLAGYLTGITWLIAILINHLKYADMRGSWLEDHFRWQIRTFWYTVLWAAIGSLLTLVLVGFVILAVLTVWNIYRLVKGLLRLLDGRSPYGGGLLP